MIEASDLDKGSAGKSVSAFINSILFVCVLGFIAWLAIGQLLPRLLMTASAPVVKQELSIQQSAAEANPPALKRQLFHDQLEAKEKEIIELKNRLDAQETRLKTIEENAQKNIPVDTSAISEAAAAQAKTAAEQAAKSSTEFQSALAQAQADYNEKLKQLQHKLDVLEARPTESEQNRTRIAGLESSVSQQRTLIETIKSEVAQAQLQTVRQLSALASFVPMKEAIQRGESFDVPLSQMLNFTNGNRKVEALAGQLRPIAKEGVPSLAQLKTEFDALVVKALASGKEKGSFSGNLRSLISIRKTGEQQGDSDESIIARAEKRLGQGDIDASLKELDKLSGNASSVMKNWMDKAHRYVAIRGIINDMQLALTQDIPAVQTSMPAPAIPAVAPEAPLAAPKAEAAPVAQPPAPAAVPAKAEAAAAKAKDKPQPKPAAPKPATKEPVAKDKTAAKTAPKVNDDAEESEPAAANQDSPKPAKAAEPETKNAYPGN